MADRRTIDYYNSNATIYGNVAPDPNGDFVAYRKRFVEKLNRGDRILDLGCGGGHASLAFLEDGFEVVALDGSIELARIASKLTNIEVMVKDFSKLDFQSEFDGVWAAASLTHVSLDSLDDVLKRVCSALRIRGLLCASFKCAETDWRDNAGRFYSAISPEILHQFMNRAGLKVNSVDVVHGQGRFHEPTTWAWLSASRVDIS